MAIPSTLVGMEVPPIVHEVDSRWTMAFAAALGDDNPRYLDTSRSDGVVAHPLFSVCPEWPVIVSSRAASEKFGLTAAEVASGVHATHDVTIHRLIKPGDVVTTRLDIVGLVDIAPGTKTTTRLETVDAGGQRVASTKQDAIYLGVRSAGADQPDPGPRDAIEGTERFGQPVETEIELAAGAAHTYTECARIWNPIHTDRAVAHAAGLPDIILHGTATLAHGVSTVVAQHLGNDPDRVRRIACRFAAMVLLPSTITVRVWPGNVTTDGRTTVPFEVINAQGDPAVKDGLLVFGDPPAER